MQKILEQMRGTDFSYRTKILYYVIVISVLWTYSVYSVNAEPVEMDIRARARDIGIEIGNLPTGTHNAITDVAGVKVGHVTLNEGDSIRTGVTAVIPSDDIWTARLFGAAHTIHGNGEATGYCPHQSSWVDRVSHITYKYAQCWCSP